MDRRDDDVLENMIESKKMKTEHIQLSINEMPRATEINTESDALWNFL